MDFKTKPRPPYYTGIHTSQLPLPTKVWYVCYISTMNILITGFTGFIGRELNAHFVNAGHKVTAVTRQDFQLPGKEFLSKVDGQDVIIHLAGAPLAKRWTHKYLEEIVNSRIETTKKLVKAIKSALKKPSLFISTSAIGIYDEEKIYSEKDAVYANDFIGKLCVDWENEALQVESLLRTVIFRIGVVLDSGQGALKKMLTPFRLGLGGPIGSGKQQFSWIHIYDLVNAFQFIIDEENFEGAVNLTSPQTVTNMEFTRILGKALKRPVFLPVSPLILKIIYGKGAMLITKSQGAYPERLLEGGFKFKFGELKKALMDLIRHKN